MALEHSVRLAGTHGYLIEGDTACLNADLVVDEDVSNTEKWSLQLWAREPTGNGSPSSGTKVAEVPFAVSSPLDTSLLHVEARSPALIPAGRREYLMSLVLASSGPDAPERVHDFATYPRCEVFALPHLEGNVGYSSVPDGVTLHAERIVNPRPRGSSSGSLALELWALGAPYSGQALDGILLAHVELAPIEGGGVLEPPPLVAAPTEPPVGQWHMVLLLREWTAAAGFVTRDWCNFEIPWRAPDSHRLVASPEHAAARNGREDVADGRAPGRMPVPSWSHDELALAAFYRYLARGGAGGDELQDWLDAERDLLRRDVR